MFSNRHTLAAALLTATLLSACEAAPPTTDALFARGTQITSEQESALVAFRHDLHRHPEVAGEEIRTARKVAEELRALGYEVQTGVGGHGVVGLLNEKKDGKLIAFRADMDAVYNDAPDPVSYASVIDGVRHICGHDLHTTVGIGLAKAFAEIADDLPGRVMLIFQPAEETVTGARAMLEAGLFEDLKPDAIFGLHTFPYEVGTMGTMPEGLMAWSMGFEVELTGEPPLDAAGQDALAALEELNTVPLGEELTRFPLSFTYLRSGVAPSSDPQSLIIRGEARQSGFDRQETFREALYAAVSAALPEGTEMMLKTHIISEGVDNPEGLVEAANRALADHMPSLEVRPVETIYPPFSEDFGSFQREVPGVFYFLGVNNSDAGTRGFPHMPDYVADDGAIQVGANAMLAIMLDAMAEDSG